MRHYETNAAGFRHLENNELRAVVPWASLADYRETCPDAPDAPVAADPVAADPVAADPVAADPVLP